MVVKRIPLQIKIRNKIYSRVDKWDIKAPVTFMTKKEALGMCKFLAEQITAKYGKVYATVRQYSYVEGHPFYVIFRRTELTEFAKRRKREFLKEANK